MKSVTHLCPQIVSVENLLSAWEEFIEGKKKRTDVQIFSQNLLQNIILINRDLTDFTYKHGGYQQFRISDPKTRIIHKATVRDRLVHHAIYRVLYPIFDKSFVYDSYSCRLEKGTHRAVKRLENFTRKVSLNYSNPCFVLKCDVKKFFASVDHEILLKIIERKVTDPDLLWLLQEIIGSYGLKSVIQLGLFDFAEQNRERERERIWSRDSNRQFNQSTFCQYLYE
ncbi:MAG: reverse transcriptase domain-containing protein [Candidatus Berkelbacteria bacterium]|nr:reverse transcriptase domain-containing protein [Candidatus Berkelbacteria bacterium]